MYLNPSYNNFKIDLGLEFDFFAKLERLWREKLEKILLF